MQLRCFKLFHLKKFQNKELDIEFDFIDKSEFILLEIKHKGKVQVEGRISESGKIFNSETKNWLIFNVITIVFVFAMIIYSLIQLLECISAITHNSFILFILVQKYRYESI